jgi:hypothetical protein
MISVSGAEGFGHAGARDALLTPPIIHALTSSLPDS